MIRTYSELRRLETFEERFKYLSLPGRVGVPTFGHERWLNQRFYTSREWRNTRDAVIVRDYGCDLGIPGYEIHQGIVIHHMNPIRPEDIVRGNEDIMDPEYLITVTALTHNAIHYGNRNGVPRQMTVRAAGDTKLW